MAAQRWDAADYATNARFVSDLGAPVIDLLQPKAGERILDLGCGDGAMMADLAARGVQVIGIDASPELVSASQARGLDARLLDARHLSFDDEFDGVYSNAVLHWIPDHAPVVRRVFRALKPGGRFAGEFGGHGCIAAVCTALRAVAVRRGVDLEIPWNYATVDDFESQLLAVGFEDLDVRLIPRPTLLPSGMAAFLNTFAGWAFRELAEADRQEAFDETVELLRPSLCDARGRWTADYTRLRFVARRPSRP